MDGTLSTSSSSVPIRKIEVSAFTIPTDFPEADGTLQWNKTTMVLVHVEAGGKCGLGYTYADTATAELIRSTLADEIEGADALAPGAVWNKMVHRIRNLGRPGICSMAISAVDLALFDLKAKLLNLPLVTLLGQVRPGTPIYGSGGFISYSNAQLEKQLGCWVKEGIRHVKMKVGRHDLGNPDRVRTAQRAIGREVELYVDANGAYSRKEALQQAEMFAEFDVTWFEEPVSSDDLEGLHLIRDRAPARIDIAAGEYGYDLGYFRRMLDAGAVDVLQADATRCGGVTGFLGAAALCHAHGMPLSAHTAPTLHMHLGAAALPVRNLEYFHDHVRIERMLFDGLPKPEKGELRPDLSRPGVGLELKRADAQRFAA
ncbi:MAG: enolase C-terminal domain-like protein [Terriglobales bacterium]